MSFPNEDARAPFARCAAAGAKISRPWNVRLTGLRKYFAAVISRALCARPEYTIASAPLSGPTKYWPAASIRMGRRADPTPGSTTTTWTVFGGKYRIRLCDEKGAFRDLKRMDLVTDVDDRGVGADGKDDSFHDSGKWSRVPKSVVSVTIGFRIPIAKLSKKSGAFLLLR